MGLGAAYFTVKVVKITESKSDIFEKDLKNI